MNSLKCKLCGDQLSLFQDAINIMRSTEYPHDDKLIHYEVYCRDCNFDQDVVWNCYICGKDIPIGIPVILKTAKSQEYDLEILDPRDPGHDVQEHTWNETNTIEICNCGRLYLE